LHLNPETASEKLIARVIARAIHEFKGGLSTCLTIEAAKSKNWILDMSSFDIFKADVNQRFNDVNQRLDDLNDSLGLLRDEFKEFVNELKQSRKRPRTEGEEGGDELGTSSSSGLGTSSSSGLGTSSSSGLGTSAYFPFDNSIRLSEHFSQNLLPKTRS
jgi:hypothetical protein